MKPLEKIVSISIYDQYGYAINIHKLLSHGSHEWRALMKCGQICESLARRGYSGFTALNKWYRNSGVIRLYNITIYSIYNIIYHIIYIIVLAISIIYIYIWYTFNDHMNAYSLCWGLRLQMPICCSPLWRRLVEPFELMKPLVGHAFWLLPVFASTG